MEVEKHVGSHPETNMIGNIPYAPRVKKVLACGRSQERDRTRDSDPVPAHQKQPGTTR